MHRIGNGIAFRAIGSLAVIFGMLAFGAGCQTNMTPPPIVIGHVSDTTRLDKAGAEAEFGIRLALHDMSKGDALTEAFHGRAVQVRHTDAHGELAAFESEAVRLDTVNRCLALVGGYSAQEVAALDHVKVPVLTFYGQPVIGASSDVFYLGMAPVRQGEVLASASAENAGIQRVAILVDERRAESAALADAFQKTFAATRKDEKPGVVLQVRFGKDASWSDLMVRVRDQEAQAIVFAGTVQDFNACHKAYRQEYFVNEPELVFAGPDGEQRLFDVGPASKGSILLATAFYADAKSEKIAGFMKSFQDAFHTEADVHAALAYDGFKMLIEAMKKANPQLTPEHVREELLKIKDFDGLTGPLTVMPNRQMQRTLFVVRWQNGVMTLVKPFPAGT